MFLPGFRTLRSLRFLFTAPIILAFLFVINLMTSPGHWWVQWAALGLGIAWFFALVRVIWGIILAGGLTALGIYLYKRGAGSAGTSQTAGASDGSRPPDIPTTAIRRE
jgi:hypothetical protein